MPAKQKSKSFVVAVTGVSGAGKTSLVKKIAALLDGTKSVDELASEVVRHVKRRMRKRSAR